MLTVIIFVAGIQSTQAAVFNYSGTVTGGSGSFLTLVPVDSLIAGTIEIDGPDGAGTVTDTSSLLGINLLITDLAGNSLFCFNYNTTCSGGTPAPITQIESVDLTFNTNGEPVLGGFLVTVFSPTFFLAIPIEFDVTNGLFVVDGGPAGVIAGEGNFEFQPVPLPAAAWMLVSALISLGVLKRASF